MKTIEITVDAKGQAKVQTKGFASNSCRDASRLIEQALGDRTQEQLTTEFYETTNQQYKSTISR